MSRQFADLIEQFLKEGASYFQSWQVASLFARHGGNDDRMLAAEERRWKARASILRIGRELAPALESDGGDSTALLRLLHAVDAGGGPEAAAPLWADLKATLQRFALRKQIGKVKPGGEGAMHDNIDDAALLSPRDLARHWGLKQDAVEAALRRADLPDAAYVLNENRGPRDPERFYRVSAVRPILDPMRDKLSRERPAKKNLRS